MAIGDRPYEVARSEDVRAEGPPYLCVHILLAKDAYDLVPTVRKWKSELGKAGGEAIVLVFPGDSEQSDPLYKDLRTPERVKTDSVANLEYRRALAEMGGTAAADIHIHIERTLETAARLGVPSESLPCIMWRTVPDMRPPLLTPIKPGWYRDEPARHQFMKAFAGWLRQERIPTPSNGTFSVAELRRWVSRQIKNLTTQVDRAVGCARPPRRVRRDRPLSAVVLLDGLEDDLLRRPQPAKFSVRHRDAPQTRKLTQSQFFYLTAFMFLGETRRSDNATWKVVSEDSLATRLLAWQKAGLRTLGRKDKDSPRRRLSKEWPRFVEQMHDRIATDGWFDERVWRASDEKRFMRQRSGKVTVRMNPEHTGWLRKAIVRLTGKQ